MFNCRVTSTSFSELYSTMQVTCYNTSAISQLHTYMYVHAYHPAIYVTEKLAKYSNDTLGSYKFPEISWYQSIYFASSSISGSQ